MEQAHGRVYSIFNRYFGGFFIELVAKQLPRENFHINVHKISY